MSLARSVNPGMFDDFDDDAAGAADRDEQRAKAAFLDTGLDEDGEPGDGGDLVPGDHQPFDDIWTTATPTADSGPYLAPVAIDMSGEESF